MRLIDADRLIELFTPYVSEDKKIVYKPRQLKIDDIKNAPAVDAIPVEWAEKWFENALHYANDGDDVTVDVMLDAWREENEIKRYS